MLTLGRSVHEFKDFDVRRRHHESVAVRAVRIANEFDQTDDPISDATARRMAYEGGVPKPSAYDFIFLCNFLTEPGMTETFSLELRRLASSLTPGGLMVILGGTGQHYPDLYERIREIAATARLRDVSPSKPLPSNEGSALLRLIAEHVRENVEWALANCPSEVRAAAVDKLPSDIVDDTVQFRLPKFQALVFVGQAHVRSGTRKLQRIGIRAE